MEIFKQAQNDAVAGFIKSNGPAGKSKYNIE